MAILKATTESESTRESIAPAELLIKEARRKARRRRLVAAAATFAALLVIVSLVVELNRGSTKPRQPRTARSSARGATSPGIPVGPYASLDVAGSLAVSPNGRLYVVDVARDRILARLDDGRFRVVAGDGRVGFSGDDGPAYKAELSSVSQIAFGPRGSLYIADGDRVRVVNSRGIIRTVAGDGGGSRPQRIVSGTPALSASLGSQLSIALGAQGQFYISTGLQLLRVTRTGRLDPLRVTAHSGPLKIPPDPLGAGEIAVSTRGTVYVSGINGWAIWKLSRRGVGTYVAYARRSGGDYPVLERGPGGAVFADTGSGIVKVEPRRLIPTFEFNKVRGEYFSLTYFAFGSHGSIYADDIPGNTGFEAHQQLVSVSGNRIRLLWQQRNIVSR
jgi:hypothetical protein